MNRQQASPTSKEFSSTIDQVRRPLEAWRKTRQRCERIPEPLWAAMAKLARTYGVSSVSGALGIDYYALKDRVTASPKSAGPASRNPRAFIELRPLPSSQPAACRVELEDRSGTKMTLHLDGNGVDALSLVQAFWRRRP
jgi:hypothetical protein